MKKLLFFVALAVVGCGGGGSGVDGNKKVAALSASEQMEECTYAVSIEPKRTVMCSATQTVTVGGGDVASCVTNLQNESTAHPGCAATVSQFEACEEDIFAEPDSFFCGSSSAPPPSCAPLMAADCN